MTTPAPGAGGTSSQIAAQLRDRIIFGQLRSGTPVRDTAVAVELGVSRNTARESLSLLRHEGLLEHRPNQGFVVRTLCAGDIRDIYAARTAVEIRGVQVSALAPEEALVAVGAAVRATEAAERSGRWEDYASSSLGFHAALVHLLGSPLLEEFFASILGRLRLAFAAAEDPQAFQRPWGAKDREIWEHLADGDRAGAERLLRLYLQDSELEVLDLVQHSATHMRRTRRHPTTERAHA